MNCNCTLSKAEDYGIFSFQLDDGPESEAIDLFSAKLQPPMVFKAQAGGR